MLFDAIAFLGEGQINESESNVNLKNPVGIATCRDFFDKSNSEFNDHIESFAIYFRKRMLL